MPIHYPFYGKSPSVALGDQVMDFLKGFQALPSFQQGEGLERFGILMEVMGQLIQARFIEDVPEESFQVLQTVATHLLPWIQDPAERQAAANLIEHFQLVFHSIEHSMPN